MSLVQKFHQVSIDDLRYHNAIMVLLVLHLCIHVLGNAAQRKLDDAIKNRLTGMPNSGNVGGVGTTACANLLMMSPNARSPSSRAFQAHQDSVVAGILSIGIDDLPVGELSQKPSQQPLAVKNIIDD